MAKMAKMMVTVVVLVMVMCVNTPIMVNAQSNYKNEWVNSNGLWYYYDYQGNIATNQYVDGYWVGSDGAWNTNYSGGTWVTNENGTWYQDGAWYPVSEKVTINGVTYYFDNNGYLKGFLTDDGTYVLPLGKSKTDWFCNNPATDIFGNTQYGYYW